MPIIEITTRTSISVTAALWRGRFFRASWLPLPRAACLVELPIDADGADADRCGVFRRVMAISSLVQGTTSRRKRGVQHNDESNYPRQQRELNGLFNGLFNRVSVAHFARTRTANTAV